MTERRSMPMFRLFRPDLQVRVAWFSVAIFSLAITSISLAQTSQPSARPPTAVKSAFDHDAIHRTAGASPAVGKTAAVAPPAPGNPFDVKRVATALAIVLGLIFVFRWAARWMFPAAGVGRSSQVIKVLSRSVVAPKQQFLLIQIGRRLVLVGDCGTQMSALAEITDPDEVASLVGQLAERHVTEPNIKFGGLLGRATRSYDQADDRAIMTASDDDEEELVATGVDETRGELTGLTEKIRLLSRQFERR